MITFAAGVKGETPPLSFKACLFLIKLGLFKIYKTMKFSVSSCKIKPFLVKLSLTLSFGHVQTALISSKSLVWPSLALVGSLLSLFKSL